MMVGGLKTPRSGIVRQRAEGVMDGAYSLYDEFDKGKGGARASALD